jgi:phosphatidylglycerol---prolipoprotein diacylglyceryl transferase
LNGITIDIDPHIVHLGPLMLRWYSLFFATAVIAGVWLGLREGRRKGLDMERLPSLALWAVIGGMVGARLFHVIDRWDLYADHPLQILDLSGGGLAVYGGFIGGIAAGLIYALRFDLPIWKLGDAAAPGMILGAAIGRLGCIVNGDAVGGPTSLPWGFIYTHPDAMVPRELFGVATHPYPVYEMIFSLGLLALLLRLRSVYRVDGLLFFTAVIAYAGARFVLSYLRQEQVWFAGLQEAQIIALLTVAAAAPFVAWRLASSARQGPEAREVTARA